MGYRRKEKFRIPVRYGVESEIVLEYGKWVWRTGKC